MGWGNLPPTPPSHLLHPLSYDELWRGQNEMSKTFCNRDHFLLNEVTHHSTINHHHSTTILHPLFFTLCPSPFILQSYRRSWILTLKTYTYSFLSHLCLLQLDIIPEIYFPSEDCCPRLLFKRPSPVLIIDDHQMQL